jgi:hypothetical protein
MVFDELPLVRDADDMRRVHRETATYFLSKTGVAHADMNCHLAAAESPEKFIQNPRWRVASDVQCRQLKASWCESCCGT